MAVEDDDELKGRCFVARYSTLPLLLPPATASDLCAGASIVESLEIKLTLFVPPPGGYNCFMCYMLF